MAIYNVFKMKHADFYILKFNICLNLSLKAKKNYSPDEN